MFNLNHCLYSGQSCDNEVSVWRVQGCSLPQGHWASSSWAGAQYILGYLWAECAHVLGKHVYQLLQCCVVAGLILPRLLWLQQLGWHLRNMLGNSKPKRFMYMAGYIVQRS